MRGRQSLQRAQVETNVQRRFVFEMHHRAVLSCPVLSKRPPHPAPLPVCPLSLDPHEPASSLPFPGPLSTVSQRSCQGNRGTLELHACLDAQQLLSLGLRPVHPLLGSMQNLVACERCPCWEPVASRARGSSLGAWGVRPGGLPRSGGPQTYGRAWGTALGRSLACQTLQKRQFPRVWAPKGSGTQAAQLCAISHHSCPTSKLCGVHHQANTEEEPQMYPIISNQRRREYNRKHTGRDISHQKGSGCCLVCMGRRGGSQTINSAIPKNASQHLCITQTWEHRP